MALRLQEGVEDYIPSLEIRERTEILGEYYTDRYGNEEVVLLTVMKGATHFGVHLGEAIRNPNILEDYMRMQSMEGTRSNGAPTQLADPYFSLKDRNVLVVEDIDDTRTTLATAIPRLRDQAPKRLDIVSLLEKPDADKSIEIEDLPCDDIKYGFQIASRFVIGHGLDWEQRYRSLPHITVAENIAPGGEPEFWVPIVAIEPAHLSQPA